MSYAQAILLGLVQGVTEFLPVSSSGHLAILQNIFGITLDPTTMLFFNVLLHVGTLIAVCIVYAGDITEMILEFFHWIGQMFKRKTSARIPPARRMIFLLVIATLPLFLFIPVRKVVEELAARPLFIGVALLVTGLLLWLSDRVPKGHKDEMSATVLDAVCVGLMQGIAIIPGLSRSGTTISTGMFRGFNRKFAVRFSFLMSLPTILGALVLQLKEVLELGTLSADQMPPYLVGMVVAMVSGLLAISLVRYLVQKGKFGWFAYYCFLAGLAAIFVPLAIT